jgi:competence protein ComEA
MLNLDKAQKRILLLMATVLVLLTGVYVIKELLGQDDPISEYERGEMILETKPSDNTLPSQDNPEADNIEPPQKIKVYITGQIKYPGVIEIEEGSRLADVIEQAGGVLEEADLMRVNLALKVQDEGMYIIPKVGEELPSQEIHTSGTSLSGHQQKVNINTADEALLVTLPSIGPSRAKGIIEYRERNGPFQSIEELKNVAGIGEKIFEQLKDLVTIR